MIIEKKCMFCESKKFVVATEIEWFKHLLHQHLDEVAKTIIEHSETPYCVICGRFSPTFKKNSGYLAHLKHRSHTKSTIRHFMKKFVKNGDILNEIHCINYEKSDQPVFRYGGGKT